MSTPLEDVLEPLLEPGSSREQLVRVDRFLHQTGDARALAQAAEHVSMNGLLRLAHRPADDSTAFVESVLRRVRQEQAVFVAAASLPASRSRKGSFQTSRAALAVAACVLTALVVTAFQSWLNEPSALVEVMAGVARVERGGKTLPVRAGMALKEGDVLELQPSATAVISWKAEATRITLEDSARLNLAALHPAKVLRLHSGRMHAEVAAQELTRPMEISTPNGRMEVLGTSFQIEELPGQTTRLRVTEGQVLLTPLGDPDAESRIIGALEEAVVSPHQPFSTAPLPFPERLEIGLVAHWPLDDGSGASFLRDLQGRHALRVAGAVAWDQRAFPLFRRRAEPPALISPLRLPEGDFSLSFRLRHETDEDGAWGGISTLAATSIAGANQPGLRVFLGRLSSRATGHVYEDDGRIRLQTGDGRRSATAQSRAGVITKGRWHTVALVVQRHPIPTAHVFVDGCEVTEHPYLLPGWSGTHALQFVSMPGAHPNSLNGSMTDIRLFSRRLNQEEIVHLARTPDQP